jgi:hypothetical protein
MIKAQGICLVACLSLPVLAIAQHPGGGRAYICPARSISVFRSRAVQLLTEWDESFRTYGLFATLLNEITYAATTGSALRRGCCRSTSRGRRKNRATALHDCKSTAPTLKTPQLTALGAVR